jgi:CheY-like chemotaxis protein
MRGRQQTVLVVEDDDDLRLMYRNALAFAGYAVHDVANGFDAIRRIDSAPPDLVVLDLRLPGLSGFAVQQEISAQAHTRSIPIVVVTGSAEDLAHLDVSCVLRKPVDLAELIRVVQRCMAKGVGAAGV